MEEVGLGTEDMVVVDEAAPSEVVHERKTANNTCWIVRFARLDMNTLMSMSRYKTKKKTFDARYLDTRDADLRPTNPARRSGHKFRLSRYFCWAAAKWLKN